MYVFHIKTHNYLTQEIQYCQSPFLPRNNVGKHSKKIKAYFLYTLFRLHVHLILFDTTLLISFLLHVRNCFL